MSRRRRARWPAVVVVVAGCAASEPASREQRLLDALAEDNYAWALREPELVAMKLHKMQRGPYEWLRGSATVYWRDLMEPGAVRSVTAFGDPPSSRVLIVGDPHIENVGTFRATDGTMLIDWNDFDGTGYGPFTGDLRRLAVSFVIVAELGVPDDPAYAGELARLVATSYAAQIEDLASGAEPTVMGFGATAMFDHELETAEEHGDEREALAELAPIVGEVRELALGDLEPIGPDGVFEARITTIGVEQADWIERAVAQWRIGKLDAAAATIKLCARRIGTGVSSYAAYRFAVVLEGPTVALEDDLVIELKEIRDGVLIQGVPQLAAGEWDSPGERSVDTQKRLQARRDSDGLLGSARLGGLSMKIRDGEAYQHGINAVDLVELAAGDDEDRDGLRELAGLYGGLLARAHGQALTADGVAGHAVIAPLLAGRASEFADEIERVSATDAAQLVADYTLMKDRDLAAEIALVGSQ